MPEISRFYGILIRMFVEPGGRHSPHFHAYYEAHFAVFGIAPVEMLAGAIPRRQRRLVGVWAELHRDELMAAWDNLQQGRAPLPIDPLR